jgi:hypothetical protein
MEPDRTALDRRRFLVLGGMAVVAACSSDSEDDAATTTTGAAESSSTTAATEPTVEPTTSPVPTDAAAFGEPADGELAPFQTADFEGLGVCTLLAATAAGPFPNPTQLDRRDVTDGYPGHALRLGLRVIDQACEPIPGAIVEIWHADASGDYSGYADGGTGKDEGEGTAFMRGFQTAGDDGIVEFHTIYPGWYPGRAVHIHLTAHIGGGATLTSQLFFEDAYSADVFTAAPYAEFGPPDTSNASDFIAGPAITTGGLLTLTPGATAAGPGTVALTNVGVSA